MTTAESTPKLKKYDDLANAFFRIDLIHGKYPDNNGALLKN